MCLFVAGISAHAQEDASENRYLKWHHDHFDETAKSILNYLEANELLPLVNQGPLSLSLREEPTKILEKDSNTLLTVLCGEIESDETHTYVLFVMKQQIDPYESFLVMFYTCDQDHYMPSLLLYLEIQKALNYKIGSLSLESPNTKLHISTVETHLDGSYLQEWQFYDDTSMRKVSIRFTPDGMGATNYLLFAS